MKASFIVPITGVDTMSPQKNLSFGKAVTAAYMIAWRTNSKMANGLINAYPLKRLLAIICFIIVKKA